MFNKSWQFRLSLNEKSEKLYVWLAKLIPKPVLYWAIVRVACQIEPQDYPGDVRAIKMLQLLEYR